MDAAVDSYEKSKPFVFKPSKKSKEVGNRHHRSPEKTHFRSPRPIDPIHDSPFHIYTQRKSNYS